MKRSQLSIDVQCNNTLKNSIKELLPLLMTALAPFIGVKIFGSGGGGASKKFEDCKWPEKSVKYNIDGVWVSFSYYLKFYYNQLQLCTTVCISGGSHDTKPSTAYCQYTDKNLILGEVINGVLTSLDSTEALIKSHGLNDTITEAELTQLIVNYRESLKITEALKNKIPHCFAHERYAIK